MKRSIAGIVLVGCLLAVTLAGAEAVLSDTPYENKNATQNTSAGTNASAQQGTWRKDPGGVWYQMPDGLYICNQWKQIDGKWYFFGLDGYMVTSRWEGDYYLTADGTMAVSTYIDGYYVGADGKWVGNAKKKRVTPAQTQITSDGAVIATQGEWYKDSGNGRWYFIRNDGTRLKHMWAWIDSNGDGYAECYYFNKQGFMSSGAIIDGNRVNYNGKWVRNGSVQLRPVVR